MRGHELTNLTPASNYPPGTTTSQPMGNIGYQVVGPQAGGLQAGGSGETQPPGSGMTIINLTVINPTQPFVISANQMGGT